ncbi:hypothetical protein [Methylobacterium flocculans]|uniref:hypothetical protein n=1 Tax=Methylobacterium flocculans TaxID=2984843 RepID=UPI0021F274B5|nr:hypothetical protein [Methylobacterium sp. FF17]
MRHTTIKTTILALATAATLGTGFGAFEARAQYYEDDRPRRVERRYEEDRYERRRFDEDRYDRRPRRYEERFGRLCLTQRGNCVTEPQPWGSQCRCMIPGFGPKRGEIRG